MDDVTLGVVSHIADEHSGVLTTSMAADGRGQPAASIASYQCILRYPDYLRETTQGTWQTALDCLERTLAAEPDYAEAAASLASIQMDGYLNAFGFDETALVRAEKLARHAIDINPLSQMGWFQLGIVHFYKRENDRALKAFEHTLALNPNSPFFVGTAGWGISLAGQWERGRELIEKAIALNPKYPTWFHYPTFLGLYRDRKFEEALAETRKIDITDFFWTPLEQAAAFGQLGQVREGRTAIERLLELNPDFVNKPAEYIGFYVHETALIDLLMDGLRKAGLPDPPGQPSRPVIAVLPFTNLSGDPEQDYFADGITEDIITRLSDFQQLGVIARNSTFQYRGGAHDVRAVGKDLNASHIVEGSIRTSSNRIRATVQLIDASDGNHLWSECSAPGSLDTSLSHAAGLIEIAACHA